MIIGRVELIGIHGSVFLGRDFDEKVTTVNFRTGKNRRTFVITGFEIKELSELSEQICAALGEPNEVENVLTVVKMATDG